MAHLEVEDPIGALCMQSLLTRWVVVHTGSSARLLAGAVVPPHMNLFQGLLGLPYSMAAEL